jgi:TolA-binding protein
MNRKLTIVAAGLLCGAAAAWAGNDRGESTAGALKDAGLRYEAVRLQNEAERVAGLEEVAKSAASVARSGSDDEKAAARALAAAAARDRDENVFAAEEYKRAAEGFGKSVFADDVSFASIQALEASGDDARAAGEWAEWMDRFPQSPLRGEALLAQAWNALRRGDPTVARKHLNALTTTQSWAAGDRRVALALATTLYAQGKVAEAMAALPKEASGPTATYLRGLLYRAQGAVLRSAASFQEVADRYPNSALRDPALLGKADAFLVARDYRSAAEEFTRTASKARDPRVVA